MTSTVAFLIITSCVMAAAADPVKRDADDMLMALKSLLETPEERDADDMLMALKSPFEKPEERDADDMLMALKSLLETPKERDADDMLMDLKYLLETPEERDADDMLMALKSLLETPAEDSDVALEARGLYAKFDSAAECMEGTSNCYGHGSCAMKIYRRYGISYKKYVCKCTGGYHERFNCEVKYSGSMTEYSTSLVYYAEFLRYSSCYGRTKSCYGHGRCGRIGRKYKCYCNAGYNEKFNCEV